MADIAGPTSSDTQTQMGSGKWIRRRRDTVGLPPTKGTVRVNARLSMSLPWDINNINKHVYGCVAVHVVCVLTYRVTWFVDLVRIFTFSLFRSACVLNRFIYTTTWPSMDRVYHSGNWVAYVHSINVTYGKIGRFGFWRSSIILVKRQCLPIPLYGLKCYPLINANIKITWLRCYSPVSETM